MATTDFDTLGQLHHPQSSPGLSISLGVIGNTGLALNGETPNVPSYVQFAHYPGGQACSGRCPLTRKCGEMGFFYLFCFHQYLGKIAVCLLFSITSWQTENREFGRPCVFNNMLATRANFLIPLF
jgi:hypothetical protein